MLDQQLYKRTVIRYWERRRIIYNVALVPPALSAYLIAGAIDNAGDPHPIFYGLLLFCFSLAAIGANICYSFVYALEFLFGSDDPDSNWSRFGRSIVLIEGIIFAMGLAFFGGRSIAAMEYNQQFNNTWW